MGEGQGEGDRGSKLGNVRSENEDIGKDLSNDELSDYNDLGLVELWSDESEDISNILYFKHTSQDKMAYTIFTMNIFITCYLIGFAPNYFYLWHTFKFFALIPYRWYAYKKQRFHYFLFDFCYFTNVLILLYLWLPGALLGPTIRGHLFTTCFSFANGPVLSAIMMWRNSVVPHSNDKMTSLFIHVSPALTLFGLRWYSMPEQEFSLCAQQQEGFEVSGCPDVGLADIIYYPVLMYLVWQILYVILVEVIRKENVEKRNYATSYKYIVEKSKSSLYVRIFSLFGPKYRKLMFISWQLVYTTIAMSIAYFCYKSMLFNMFAVVLVMSFASYNGASFYIDVFSRKYDSKSS